MQKLILVAFLSILSQSIIAQNVQYYYVTIGVFANSDNANRLIEKATKEAFSPANTVRTARKLNYVYVLKTENKREAFALAIKLRVETDYKGAWVFESRFSDEPAKIVPPKDKEQEPKVVPQEPVKQEPVIEIKPTEITTPPIDSATLVPPVEVVEKPVVVAVVPKPTEKPFYFKLTNAADGTEVKNGEVHLMQTPNDTHYQTFKPGEIVYLDVPKNKRGTYTMVTQVTGYGNISTTFDFKNPEGEIGSKNEVIIEVHVNKAKKGDYIDFNNVKFFKNASILQPAAQNELDGVVDLMKESPKYKVKIHGHVNGTNPRDSFIRGENSGFFATNIAVDKVVKKMSAKDLSLARAETIRNYLITQGIEAERITTKGEGGKIPIYPEVGSLGVLNDRVEIEFVKH